MPPAPTSIKVRDASTRSGSIRPFSMSRISACRRVPAPDRRRFSVSYTSKSECAPMPPVSSRLSRSRPMCRRPAYCLELKVVVHEKTDVETEWAVALNSKNAAPRDSMPNRKFTSEFQSLTRGSVSLSKCRCLANRRDKSSTTGFRFFDGISSIVSAATDEVAVGGGCSPLRSESMRNAVRIGAANYTNGSNGDARVE